MSKKYPYYGKRFARQKINEFAEVIFQIYRMDARQLRAIRKEAEQLSQTNCGWNSYYMKELNA